MPHSDNLSAYTHAPHVGVPILTGSVSTRCQYDPLDCDYRYYVALNLDDETLLPIHVEYPPSMEGGREGGREGGKRAGKVGGRDGRGNGRNRRERGKEEERGRGNKEGREGGREYGRDGDGRKESM